MIIRVLIKINKKNFLIEKINNLETDKNVENTYSIHTTTVPKNNKTNREIIEKLSKYFQVSQNQIIILQGLKSKNKIIKILNR